MRCIFYLIAKSIGGGIRVTGCGSMQEAHAELSFPLLRSGAKASCWQALGRSALEANTLSSCDHDAVALSLSCGFAAPLHRGYDASRKP